MDKLLFGLSVAGIGLVVVFVGLILLIFCLQIITKLATAGDKKNETKQTAPVAAPVIAPIAASAVAEGIPADVIAAITAAISVVWQSENGFVVRHVKRVSNAPAWGRAGREEQTYSRF